MTAFATARTVATSRVPKPAPGRVRRFFIVGELSEDRICRFPLESCRLEGFLLLKPLCGSFFWATARPACLSAFSFHLSCCIVVQ